VIDGHHDVAAGVDERPVEIKTIPRGESTIAGILPDLAHRSPRQLRSVDISAVEHFVVAPSREESIHASPLGRSLTRRRRKRSIPTFGWTADDGC